MSLINDALRKARQEAAEKEAEERGVAYRPPRAHLPERSRMGLGVVLGLVFGFLGAFAGAYLLLSPSAPSAPAPGPPSAQVGEPAQVAAAPSPPAVENRPVTEVEPEPTRPPAPVRQPGVEAGAATAAPSPTARPSRRAEVAAPEPSPSPVPVPPTDGADRVAAQRTEGAAATTQGAAPEPKTSPAPPPPAQPEPAVQAAPRVDDESSLPRIQPPERVGQIDDTNEFVLEADLGDVRLTLDFIVWIPGRAFAQINGRQVEEGQLVEDLLVEKIERERVTLRGANGRLILRVR